MVECLDFEKWAVVDSGNGKKIYWKGEGLHAGSISTPSILLPINFPAIFFRNLMIEDVFRRLTTVY